MRLVTTTTRVFERFERLQYRSERKPFACRGRRELLHDRAVRKIRTPKRKGVAAALASGVNAGIIDSSSGNPRAAPMPFRSVRRDRDFLR